MGLEAGGAPGVGPGGETTLLVDLVFHLASAQAWLGLDVGEPLRVLVIEDEGPRATGDGSHCLILAELKTRLWGASNFVLN